MVGFGSLDEDPLDRFLKFFVAFEMLASLMGYKGKNKAMKKTAVHGSRISVMIMA